MAFRHMKGLLKINCIETWTCRKINAFFSEIVATVFSVCPTADAEPSSLQCDKCLVRRKVCILQNKLGFYHFLFNTPECSEWPQPTHPSTYLHTHPPTYLHTQQCLLTQELLQCVPKQSSRQHEEIYDSLFGSSASWSRPHPLTSVLTEPIISYWLIPLSSSAGALLTKGISRKWRHFTWTPIAQSEKMHRCTYIHRQTKAEVFL